MKAKYCRKHNCRYLAFHGTVSVCQALTTRTRDHLLVLGVALWKLEKCPNEIFEPKKERVPTKRILLRDCTSKACENIIQIETAKCSRSACNITGKIIGDMARCPAGVPA